MTLGQDEPLPVRAAALALGIPPSTLREWPAAGLPLDDHGMCTIRDILRFCEENPRRRAARDLRERFRRPSEGPEDLRSAPATAHDDEQARAIARDMRTAAVANMEALVVAARQAEDVARGHREQLEKALLAMRAFDSALIETTAPSTLHS